MRLWRFQQFEDLQRLIRDLPLKDEQRERVGMKIKSLKNDPSAAIDLVEREVIRGLDRAAIEAVRNGVWHSFGLIALSPTLITDTALFGWRALRLTREVAVIYGLRPSQFGSLWLMRQLMSDAALIKAADLATDALGTVLGEKLAARLSAPLAEGSVASYRMARFGLLAIQRCRPIPFRQDDQLGLYGLLRSKQSAKELG